VEGFTSPPALPPGDVIVQGLQNAMMWIRCNAEVSEELFSDSANIMEYSSQAGRWGAGALVGSSTILLMAAVFIMGNAF
jgi:hypothetical protein